MPTRTTETRSSSRPTSGPVASTSPTRPSRSTTAVRGSPSTAAPATTPSATLRFTLDDEPDEAITLTILGLDDELDGLNPIAIDVNDERVYEGDNVFVNWNAVTGDPSVWSQTAFRIQPSLLEDGENTFTITNLDPSDSFNGPPYFLLGGGSIEGDVTVTFDDDGDDDPTAEDDEGNGNGDVNGNGNAGDGNDGNGNAGNGNGNGNNDDDDDDDG